MKNLILSLVACFLFSFSFSQDKSKSVKKMDANSKIAVEYLKKELRLKGEKLDVVSKAFRTYVKEMVTLNEKMSQKSKSVKGDKQKTLENKKAEFKMMTNFLKKRDASISKVLSKRESDRFLRLVKSIHPFTLEVKLKKK